MHLINLSSVTLLLSLWSEVIVTDVLPTCLSKDFKYSFTECDEAGGRWRVSVPKNASLCVGGVPNAPIRVSKCYTSCDSGHFFNSTSLSCEKCSPGYYSLGGGIRIESFKNSSQLTGFRINTQTFNNSGSCSGWHSVSNYIESVANSSGDGCVSKISYTVRIVKRGKLSFRYQYSVPEDLYNAIMFTFQYKNYDENGSKDDSDLESEANTRFLSVTEPQKWKELQINLPKPGLYVFVWRSVLFGHSRSFFQNTIGNRQIGIAYSFPARSVGHSGMGLTRIKSIFIDGVAYASQCTPCPPGTYSNVSGAQMCSLCPPDTAFAETGATECVKCDPNKYALKGSEVCTKRPICGQNDFYSIESECDLVKESQRVDYKWIEPKICRDNDNVLPKFENRYCNLSIVEKKKKESCNLGQELRDDQKCHFCDDNQYRNESSDRCQSCPPSTTPLYALSYKVWHSGRPNDNFIPEYMSTECITIEDDLEYECNSTNAWFSNTREYIRTGTTSPLHSYSFLTLTVPGFRQKSGGEITFKFEIDCQPDDECVLIFMVSRRSSPKTDIIKEWDQKTVGTKTYRYLIQQNVSLAFSWIFQRNHSFDSNAKIYEIKVTNPIVGSAIECKPCPHSNNALCIPCPYGQYFDDSKPMENPPKEMEAIRGGLGGKFRSDWVTIVGQTCKRCPKNFIINSSLAFPIGAKNSCIGCGLGLTDHNGISCYSDCKLNIGGDSFDLSQLPQPLIYKGGQLFTASGTPYFHLFNITLCGEPKSDIKGEPKFKAICKDNITGFDDSMNQEGVHSMICRSTVLPDPEQSLIAQSVSLGDDLIGISRKTSFQNITVHTEFQSERIDSDLHFYYSTSVPTTACPNGRKLTLTVRCAPELEQNLVISTPKECPDGTCDGCTFHLLVRTKTAAACRLCRSSDYETVVGECVEGVQQIHFVNPKACILSADGQNRVETRHCSVIPKQVQIGIALVSAIGVILLFLVFHFWKKNRSLEYKYCKLIEGNEKSAECCAEEEDEDENDMDDQVMIHPKKPKEVYEEGYETIQLTKHNDRNRTDII